MKPGVELVTIGDELLLGHTIDTNAAFIGRELGQAGFRVTRRATVGDEEGAIADAVRAALERAGVVICTGGLGPTQDDLTRPAVANVFQAQLEVRADLLAALQARYRQRGIPMPERNITQAEVPHGALVLPNKRGTAQGIVLTRADGHICILLPGVPHELRGMIVEQVIPFLTSTLSASAAHPIRYRVLRTTGLAESAIAESVDHLLARIAPLTLAFLPGFAGTDLRLTSWGEWESAEADRRLEDAARDITRVLESNIYGREGDELPAVVNRQLRMRGWHLAVAESCTGGLLGKLLTDAPGSSETFAGGAIVYSDVLKQTMLGVPEATLREHGAVSEETVRQMALGAQRMAGTEAALAITGIAGPGGGSPEKPVGTVWLAAVLNENLQTRRIVFPGDREEIRERSAQAALALLWKMLKAVEQERLAQTPATFAARP